MGHFAAILSPPEPEMIILMHLVSSSKFNNNKSVHQQIPSFFMSIGKGRSLLMSRSKFCLLFIVFPHHLKNELNQLKVSLQPSNGFYKNKNLGLLSEHTRD
jgi:hypothetical protein